MSSKRYVLFTVSITAILLLLFGAAVFCIDPLFHYHAPLENYEYPINDGRYQNDGILRNFDYDAIITGTSLTENFYASQLDELFNVHSVKVSEYGSTFNEINNRLKTAFKNNRKVRMIVRGLDPYRLMENKDAVTYDLDVYPTYLYDNNPINDVKYLLNKKMMFKVRDVIEYTAEGKETTSFDEYLNWNWDFEYGKNAILAGYDRREEKAELNPFSENNRKNEIENLNQNVIALAKEHPETDFYLFFPPLSIYYFDYFNQNGKLEEYFESEKLAIEMLTEYDNIYLFSFFDDFDLICNPKNYKDTAHYGEWVNSYILECMKNKEHLLTRDNYEEYCKKTYPFYLNFDYESLFAE